ncbi:PE domain-containing protein [Mycobacterium riyadhense]|uniref:PE domain-containing protein n=1 Tax=Mycobacterium riyadhense TaxID=486698 RepID=UPI002095C80D|nr:PE domain-containing protein [Mycobacterium riyadhense]
MSFQPVVADIGEQVVNIGTNALEQAAKASMSMIGLAPAGADEVSAQAAMAFHEEAAALLALNQAAQQELMRTGSAAFDLIDAPIPLTIAA